MQAFHSVRAEMAENCSAVSHPLQSSRRFEVLRLMGAKPEPETNIEPWMEFAFHGLTHASETGEPYALISCFMNGEPAALIAATKREGNDMHVIPLFMAVQPWMNFHHIAEASKPDGDTS